MLTKDEVRELEERKETARQKLKMIYPTLKQLKERVSKLEEKYAKNYVRFAEADEALSLNKFNSKKKVVEVKRRIREEYDIDKIVNGVTDEEALVLIQQILERRNKSKVY